MSDTVLMPKELTAENGAKALLIGEFKEQITLHCPECEDVGGADDCHICQGAGEYQYYVDVSWSTIKAIYKMAVEHIGIDEAHPH